MTEFKKCSGIILINNKNELALQLRASHDDSFPSHWDFAAGGGIDEGEDEHVAAERELREELGVQAAVKFVVTKRYTYPAWKPDVTREVELWIYKTRYDGPFQPNPSEVEKVEFFSVEQINQMIKTGVKFHPEFLLGWEDGTVQSTL